MLKIQKGQMVKRMIFNRSTREYEATSVKITKVARKYIYCDDRRKYHKDTGVIEPSEAHGTYIILDEEKSENKKEIDTLVKELEPKINTLSLSLLRHIKYLMENEIKGE